MWCHLCNKSFKTFEDFKAHIIQVHRNTSELSGESSEYEPSEHENAGDSEVHNDDENNTLNTMSEKYYDSDQSMAEENKSDNSTTALNTCSEKQNDSDNSMTEENDTPALNILLEKCNETASVSNMSLRKRRNCKINENKTEVDTEVSNKLLKCKKSSSLKKYVQKKKKVVFSKKKLSTCKKSAASYQKGISEDSADNNADHLASSSKTDNDFNSQPLLNANYFNPQSVPVGTQPIYNNPVFLVNPYAGQSINNYLIGNQAVQPPIYVANPVITELTGLQKRKGFVFNSKNILEWLTKHKELSKNTRYPLPESLFNIIKSVQTAIFDRYYTNSSIKEEKCAVMEVYEDLECMIQKHMNFTNNSLNY